MVGFGGLLPPWQEAAGQAAPGHGIGRRGLRRLASAGAGQRHSPGGVQSHQKLTEKLGVVDWT